MGSLSPSIDRPLSDEESFEVVKEANNRMIDDGQDTEENNEPKDGDSQDKHDILIEDEKNYDTVDATSESVEIKLLRQIITMKDAEMGRISRMEEKMQVENAKIRSMLERILNNKRFNDEGNSGVLCTRFTQISKLTDVKIRSPPVTVAGKEWVICIDTYSTPHLIGSIKYFGVYLELMNAGDERHKVSYAIKLIRENGPANIAESKNVYFDASHAAWGDAYYMTFPELLDEYVKDDSIVIEIEFTVHSISTHTSYQMAFDSAPVVVIAPPTINTIFNENSSDNYEKTNNLVKPSRACECTML